MENFEILKMDYMVEFGEEDREKALSLCSSGTTALFIYSNSLLVNSKIEKYTEEGNVRSVALDGRLMAPISFFERFYGAKVNFSGQNVSISLGDKVFESEIYECENTKYVSGEDAAAAFGFYTELLYEKRLLLISEKKCPREIVDSEKLQEALAYAIFGRFDFASFTSEDYREAREAWRLRLVGSEEINDLTDVSIREKISSVDESCEKKLSEMNLPDESGNDPVILFGELHVPTESEELTDQYQGILSLAKGYGTYGSRYYKSEQVISKILYGLRWMYDHMYGEAEIEERGWRSARAFNWWHWFCGASDALTDILIIVHEHLQREEMQKYLRCFVWVTTFMRTQYNRASASSRIKPCTKMALILEDSEWLAECHVYLDMLMGIEEYGEGLHKDYCQWTHAFPHNIAYGLGHLHRTLFVSSVMASTKMNLDGPKRYNQFNILKYTFEPAVYNGESMLMFLGRSTDGKASNGVVSMATGLLPMLGVYGEDEDRYIKGFIKRQLTTPDMIERAKRGCSLYDAKNLLDIIADDTIDKNAGYEYAHSWYTGDRAVQHRNGSAVGIALSSERECAYECINGQNKRGWHSGDGATYLYTGYDPGAYDGDNFFPKNLEIAYRIPGTTEDMQKKEERSIISSEAWHNPTAFAGSMQIEDKYILAAMEFIAMNFDGPDKNLVDTGYGTGLAVHHNDLKLKKAWFALDREIVMLGAGINSTTNSEVRTTVEHRRIVSKNDAQYLAFLDGSVEKLDTDTAALRKDGLKWALMPNHAGYVFPGGANLYASRYISEEADNQSFFELAVSHGENPKGDTYAYAILPHATEEEIRSYSESLPFRIIANTPSLQAVSKDSLGIECYVFYDPCEISGISVSEPMILTLLKKGDSSVLKVCDVTHKLTLATVALDGEFEVEGSSRIKSEIKSGKTVITVDFEGAHGRTYDIILKK